MPIPGYFAPNYGINGSSGWSGNTGSTATTRYLSPQEGDLLVALIATRTSTVTVTAPAGWTEQATVVGTDGAAEGVDVGSVRVTILTKIADGTEGTAQQSFTLSAAPSVAYATMIKVRSLTGTYELAACTLAVNGDATAWSGTATGMSTAGDLAADDLVLTFAASNGDLGAMSVSGTAIAAAGVTMSSAVEVAEASSVLGNDVRVALNAVSVTAGSSTATPTLEQTLSVAASGAIAALRIRQGAGTARTDVHVAGAGPVVVGTTSVAPGYPHNQPGDRLLMCVANRNSTVSPTTPTDWTLVATETGTLGTFGADAGGARVSVYQRDVTTSLNGAQSVTITDGNVALAQIICLRKDAAASWDALTSGSGNDETAGTAWSVTTGAMDTPTGGVALAFSAVNSDSPATISADPAFAQSGATFAATSLVSYSSTSTGNDAAMLLAEADVTTGAAAAAVTHTWTGSTAPANGLAGATIVIGATATASGDATATPAVEDTSVEIPAPTVSAGSNRTPPTLISTASATPANVSAGGTIAATVTATQDDVVLVSVTGESGNATTSFSIASPGVTFTARGDSGTFGDANNSLVQTWSFVAPTAGSNAYTVTVTRNAATASPQHTLTATVYRGSDGIGAVASTAAAGSQPSLNITTTAARSAVHYTGDDWEAVDGATRTWRTINGDTPVSGDGELYYHHLPGGHTAYAASWSDAGAIGTYAVGMTAPSGQDQAIVAVEVLGAAGGGGDATATPAVEDTSVEIPAPSVSSAAAASPAVEDTSVEIPAPTVASGQSATATPAVLGVGVEAPAPTVSSAATATPAVLGVGVEAPSPTPSSASAASPAVLDVAADFPAPTVSSGGLTVPTVRTVTSGTTSGTSATATLPADWTTDDYLVVVFSSNQVSPLTITGGTPTQLVSAGDRLSAHHVVPTAGATDLTLTIASAAVMTWAILAFSNVDTGASVAVTAGANSSNTESTIVTPVVDLGYFASGQQVAVHVAGVNSTATWSTGAATAYNTTAGNGAMTVEVETVTADAIASLPRTIDRGNSGSTRLESALSFVLSSTATVTPNLVTNGSFELGSTVATGWETEGSARPATYSLVTTATGRQQRIQFTGTTGDSGNAAIYQAPIDAAPGDIFTARVTVTGTLTDCYAIFGIEGFLTGGVYISETDTVIPAGTPTGEYEVTYVAPAGTDYVAVYVQILDIAPTTVADIQLDNASMFLAGTSAVPVVAGVALDFPAPTVSSAGTTAATPSVLDVTIAIPTAIVDTASFPDTADVALDFPAPTVSSSSGATATPAVLGVGVEVPTPTVSSGGAATATPAALGVTAELPAPTVPATSGATATPAVLGVTLDVPAPTVSAGGSAGASPAVLGASVDVPAATVGSGAALAPAVLGVGVELPAPSVTAGGSATAAPTALSVTVGVPAPTVSAGGSATATPVAADIGTAVPAPATDPGVTTSPAALDISVSLGPPTFGAGSAATASPAALDFGVIVATPVLSSGTSTSATPAGLSVTISILQAGIDDGGDRPFLTATIEARWIAVLEPRWHAEHAT